MERILLPLPWQRLEPVGGLLSLAAASPAAAAPHLQCLRDPPFSLSSHQDWVIPGDLLRRDIDEERAGLRSP